MILSDFAQGELCIEDTFDKNCGLSHHNGVSTYSTRNEWLIFDGHKYHYSNAFTGNSRYSLVAFCHKRIADLSDLQTQHLANRG